MDYIEYGASDLKLGDYYYADGTWSDGGLRKLYPDGEYEAETIAPLKGPDKRIIGIVIYAGRHANRQLGLYESPHRGRSYHFRQCKRLCNGHNQCDPGRELV